MIKKLSGNALIKDTDGDITAIDKSFKIDEKPTKTTCFSQSFDRRWIDWRMWENEN